MNLSHLPERRPAFSKMLMTVSSQCSECGARYEDAGDSCAARFEQLLALDHSRQEPWGSRHGQAFAAFALEHPIRHAASLDAAWTALYRIYILRQAPLQVFVSIRQLGPLVARDRVPPRASSPVATPTMTIADLEDFAAVSYPARLDAWCRAALATWGARSDA